MNSFLKDLGVLIFAAGEEVEKKADEFKTQREERYKEFSEKINEKKDEWKQKKEEWEGKHKDDFDKIKDKVNEVVGNLGLATKSEVDDLKKMILDLSEKIDKINK